MTIKQALEWGAKKLDKDSPSPLLDAEVLLALAVKRSREFLYSYDTGILLWAQKRKFKKLIKLRQAGVPVAYLTKNKEFFGLDFRVNKNVLIPRPETEILVGAVLEDINQISKVNGQMLIVDVGTGSGCIAVALAKNIPVVKIMAVDISSKALRIAKRNAKKHGLKKRIKFFQGNLLEPIKNKKLKNWMLAANLPYLDKNNIKPEDGENLGIKLGIKFEPRIALYGGEDGLALYREMFAQLTKFEKMPQKMYCEVNASQIVGMKNIIKNYWPETKIEVKKDLAGQDRIIMVEWR